MDKDLQRQVLQKLGLLRGLILIGLILNVVYLAALLWFILGDPKIPDFITIDRSILKIIAAILLFWLTVACLQGVYFMQLVLKAGAALDKGKSSDGVLLAQSWVTFPVGMPACIVTEDSGGNNRKLQYFAVIPLDFNKLLQGLIVPKSETTDSSQLRIVSEPGTQKPLCLVGADQSYVVCWSVPQWAMLRKIDG
jgi:hypothetical protein